MDEGGNRCFWKEIYHWYKTSKMPSNVHQNDTAYSIHIDFNREVLLYLFNPQIYSNTPFLALILHSIVKQSFIKSFTSFIGVLGVLQF